MKYRISIPAREVSVTQHYVVDARSRVDAIQKYRKGEAEIDWEEVEVTQSEDEELWGVDPVKESPTATTK